MRNLSDQEVKEQFGVETNHDRMPNGEARLRLVSDDGSSYIKTTQPGAGQWQKSHSHDTVVETYVVQAGWIALVELLGERPAVQLLLPGDVVSTRPGIAHNVYMAANSVIHTVKHGGAADWKPAPDLDTITMARSEADIRERAALSMPRVSLDQQFSSYTDVYNHLDNLIWVAPGVVLTAGLSAFGIIVELASDTTRSSVAGLGWLFLALATFFFLGGYSVMRLRFHHTLMGGEMRRLEGDGYFKHRAKSLRSWLLPSAPHLFMLLFYASAALLLAIAAMIFAVWGPLIDAMFPRP